MKPQKKTRNKPKKIKSTGRYRWIIGIAVGVTVILIAAFLFWILTPVFSKGKPVRFEVQASDTLSDVAARINSRNDNINETLFTILMTLTGQDSNIKPGPYDIRAGESPYRLMHKLSNGIFAIESITIIEGWTFRQMRKVIDKHPALKHETARLSDKELMQKLGIEYTHGEGLFYPDTYQFKQDVSDLRIYELAHKTLLKRLDALWRAKNSDLPYQSAYEALIMASIIEKETGHSKDRAMVAGVFINRLKKGMKLQTDPTVIYGMGNRYTGKIHKADLLRDTPYNTYTRKGLPPTPIALPGKAALEAAFHPAETDALYFVARGDGTSEFSNNLDDHNKAVEQYILKK
ncbi:MAG: endolytic transglycosylase MltG [Oxalobacter sp.]